jgi:hypothetical protein
MASLSDTALPSPMLYVPGMTTVFARDLSQHSPPLSFSSIFHIDILLSILHDILYRVLYGSPFVLRHIPSFPDNIPFFSGIIKLKADRLKALVLNLAHGNKSA